jgi:hypothetical protein
MQKNAYVKKEGGNLKIHKNKRGYKKNTQK